MVCLCVVFMKEEKRRLYEIIGYKEYFSDLMHNVMKLEKCRYYWSYHDKDKNDDGTLKEPHYHILIYFDNARTLSSLMKNLDFYKKEKIKYYKKGSDDGRLDYRVRYLIHYKSNDSTRFEYDISDIHTNDENIEKFFSDDTKKYNSDIALIFDFFDNSDFFVSYREFLNYIYCNNLWSTFRQNAFIFNRLFDEHNNSVKGEVLEIFK